MHFMDVKKSLAIMQQLKQYDSPTICNAIEIIKGSRQSSGFTYAPVFCTEPQLPPMVGFAKTAKIRGKTPSVDDPQQILQRRLDYHTYMGSEVQIEGSDVGDSGAAMNTAMNMATNTPTLPAVAVIEDMDYPSPVACFFGEINMVVHKGLGLKGVLTSGLVRDLDSMEKGMPIIAAGVGISHAHVHVKEINTKVNIMGMEIMPNQMVHADKHGAAVIEDDKILQALPEAINHIIAKEKIVIDAARQPDFDAAKLNEAWNKFIAK